MDKKNELYTKLSNFSSYFPEVNRVPRSDRIRRILPYCGTYSSIKQHTSLRKFINHLYEVRNAPVDVGKYPKKCIDLERKSLRLLFDIFASLNVHNSRELIKFNSLLSDGNIIFNLLNLILN